MWAVIVTGQIRTLEKTASFFSNIPGDIFAVLDDPNRDDQLVRKMFGSRLKSLEWFDKSLPEWQKVEKETEERLRGRVSDNIVNYVIRGSGSVIEYYQLYMAEKLIEKYESLNKIQYQYIFKTRCDLAWNEKINPDMLKVDPNLNLPVSEERIVPLFMSTLMSPRLIPICLEFPDSYWSPDGEKQIVLEKDVTKLLENGNFILTFRKNLAYLVRRDKFKLFSSFGLKYGIYTTDSPYWFNAETQFRMACVSAGLSVFDYHSPREEKFMYTSTSAVTPDGHLVDPTCLFCLVRM